MGGSLATKAGRHINIDIITRTLHGRRRAWAGVLIDGVSALLCLILLKASIDFVRMEMEFPQASMFFGIPVWLFEVVFPVFFFMSSLRFLVHAFDGFTAVMTGRELKGGVVAHDFKVEG
jgi:TRAP-type C4-dicarboxylate transport system permease small subunit